MPRASKTSTPVRPTARVGDADLVERRRAQIVEAATRLVARQGFAKTVVREIAEEADISVGLVYEYVRSSDPLEQLESIINFLVSISDKHSEVSHLFYREPGHLTEHGRELAENFEREMVDRISATVQSAVDGGFLRPETDPVFLSTSMILLGHGWVLKGYILDKGRTAGGYAASIAETLVQGWATPSGRKAWERRTP